MIWFGLILIPNCYFDWNDHASVFISLILFLIGTLTSSYDDLKNKTFFSDFVSLFLIYLMLCIAHFFKNCFSVFIVDLSFVLLVFVFFRAFLFAQGLHFRAALLGFSLFISTD